MREVKELFGDTDNRYFKIYPFMYELGLNPSAMMIYAVIYAFRGGEESGFWGSAEYLATAAGVGRRTVYRILKDLTERDLIEAVKTRHGRTYRTLDRYDLEKRARVAKASTEREKYTPRDPVDVLMRDKVTPELARELCEKENQGPVGQDIVEMTIRDLPPKYRGVDLGTMEYVYLNLGQYRHLRELVSEEALYALFWRLNKMLGELYERGEQGPRNHYRTLLRWIEEKNGV